VWRDRDERLAYLAGRGAGKTRSGAEWIRQKLKAGYRRIALIAPTAGDARDVMVEGVSGIMSVFWEGDRTSAGELLGIPVYELSKRRVTWANGAVATLFSAEEPERLRGPQHDAIWADELAAWADPQATWDMAMFGLRLGDRPQAMVSTTLKPLPIIRELVSDLRNVVTRATTWDNRAHLAPSFFEHVDSMR
jgi:phage terminase large subunit-like protein